MAVRVRRVVAAGLAAAAVVLVAGLVTPTGGLLGPPAAEARNADWPNTEEVPFAKCLGQQQCFDCDSGNFMACSTAGPYPTFYRASCSTGGGSATSCYQTMYNCGPLIICPAGLEMGTCYSSVWCSDTPPP